MWKRIANDGACEWCQSLQGESKSHKGIDWRRHSNCSCITINDRTNLFYGGHSETDVWQEHDFRQFEIDYDEAIQMSFEKLKYDRKLLSKDLDMFYGREAKSGIVNVKNRIARLPGKLYDKAIKMEPAITKDVLKVTKKIKTELLPLDYKIKEIPSIKNKVVKDYATKTITRIENEIYDNVRYTQVSPPSKLVDDYFHFINEMKKEGYEIVRSKNMFTDNDFYKGINSVFKNKDGYHFEMQFNTKEAINIKDNYSHVLYKELDGVNITKKRIDEINKELKDLWSSVTTPKNIKDIKTFDNIVIKK